MKKTLISLFFFLSFGLNASFNIQSSKEEVPEAVKKRATECLKRVSYCPGDPIIQKIEEKTRYRKMEEDSVRATLYSIANDCPYSIPNYLVYIQTKLKDGRFSEKGTIGEIISRDKDGKTSRPLETDWWDKLHDKFE